jgi:response regulator RpfG family c-di-GMP phosphodiesterase
MAAKPAVMFVDDESAVLESLQLTQQKHYEVRVAGSGAAGLRMLRDEPRISVVVADMRMPEMDGAAFLRNVREQAPDVVRLLLTGHADIEAAAKAINDGRIFRFLIKPCPPPEVTAALEAAVKMHRLLTGERILLEKTLIGTVKAITNVLGLTNPMALGRAARIRDRARRAAETMSAEDRWHLEFAATCSQLAAAALPDATMFKLYHGEVLSAPERDALIESMRAINRSLSESPRLEAVTETLNELIELIGNHKGVEHEESRAHPNARLLRALIDLEALESGGRSFNEALAKLRENADDYGEEALTVLTSSQAPGSRETSITGCAPACLEDGMILAEDLKTTDGLLLLPRGFELTRSSREHIVKRFGAALPRRVEVYLGSDASKSA